MDQSRKQVVERGENGNGHMSSSLQMNNGFPPRDLLRRFREANPNQNPRDFFEQDDEDDDGDGDRGGLNLGLSLGGVFGAEPKDKNNRLVRSSSIAGLTTAFRSSNEDSMSSATTHNQPVAAAYPSLFRTCSLPTETEEEWRKRKELQCLRRMEAKRKRFEKQSRINNNSSRVIASGGNKDHRASVEGNCDGGADKPVQQEAAAHHPMPPASPMNGGRVVKVEGENGFTGYPVVVGGGGGSTVKQEQQQFVGTNGFSTTSVPPPFSLPFWAAMSRAAAAAAATGGGRNHPDDNGKTGLRGLPPPSPPGSQGSSGISNDNRPVQGLNGCTEVRSPSSVQSLTEQKEQQSITDQKPNAEMENPSKKSRTISNGERETGMKGMDDMPCVTTRGDGPNGKKIQGFLYKYRKGEEVRIVCVCHGSFLTPAEFVKHGGGGDVTNPLRHIVVSPSPSFL